jgi:putative ATPase
MFSKSSTQHDDLFAAADARHKTNRPLAERLRPERLEDIAGQEHLLGPKRPLTRLLAAGRPPSLILWGPPGSGKTTLACVMAHSVAASFESLSAVMASIKDLRAVVERATERRQLHRRDTLLFIDEIHRFNKVQQDALLPHVEAGLFTLVGATTQNPSIELSAALLSRCRVFVLHALSHAAIAKVLRRALNDREVGLGGLFVTVSDAILTAIAHSANGDARRALTTLELACALGTTEAEGQKATHDAPFALTLEHVRDAAQRRTLSHNKDGDAHYDLVSAFIKSMRGSDPDAAVYYLARLIEAGEPPRFVARRMVIFASEDIGLADPRALQIAVDATRAFEMMGLPEGTLPLTQAVLYLSLAPKSNTVLRSYANAKQAVEAHGALPVPLKLRQGSTPMMRQMGYGQAYRYPHDEPQAARDETYLPEEMAHNASLEQTLFCPTDAGAEGPIVARWRAFKALPHERSSVHRGAQKS